MNNPPSTSPSKRLRCAIYTRKSTEQGLEQAFNSLDNQREAAEAYIKSQAHEGWRLLPETYDDGGQSGGSLERPALQRLLAQVRAGSVDVIVVYKVDRLTRSLSDFARLVELFDAHAVSFVSVTQAFNTTSSMGRLTLNVLLSFAQFEREVTAERIRDKVAASKRKGMRVGGPVPLGYRVRDKRLIVDAHEAEQVRVIFTRYLELGCLRALAEDLRECGITTKLTQRRDGTSRGGVPFRKGSLAYLLHNRSYIGEVIHKGQHFPGEHAPIVPRALFEAVQAALAARSGPDRISRLGLGAMLKGVLFDQHGNRMMPVTAKKGAVRYRYYVSQPRAVGSRNGEPAARVTRLPAHLLEQAVLDAIAPQRDHGPTNPSATADPPPHPINRVARVTLGSGELVIERHASDLEEGEAEPIRVPWAAEPGRRRHVILLGGASAASAVPRMRSETRARLLDGIARARLWLDDLVSGRVADTAAIALAEGCSERSVRMRLNLAFLSPELVRAAVAGTLPESHGISMLTQASVIWQRQRLDLQHEPT